MLSAWHLLLFLAKFGPHLCPRPDSHLSLSSELQGWLYHVLKNEDGAGQAQGFEGIRLPEQDKGQAGWEEKANVKYCVLHLTWL